MRTFPIAAMAAALAASAPAAAQLVPQPNSFTFPNTGVGAQSPTQMITYTNNGGQINIQSITVTGTNPGDFVLSNVPQLPESLAGGATLMFGVAFKPGAPGGRSAQIAVMTNGQNPPAVPLSGTALGPKLQVSPNPVNVGGAKVNMSTPPTSIMVANAGGGQLSIMSITLGGANSNEFNLAKVPNLPVVLGPNGNFSFTVALTPSMAAPRQAMITVVSDDPNSPMLVVPVTGSGGNPMIALDVGTVAFGNQRVGVASMPQTVTISDSGGSDLRVQSIMLAGPNAQDFMLALPMGMLPGTVQAGGSQKFTVTFNPAMVGNRTAQIVIMSDDGNFPTKFVGLLGTGTTSSIAIDPGKLDFGNQRIYTASKPQILTITNMGNDVANVVGVMIMGMNPTWFSAAMLPGLPAPIKAMGSLGISVLADPLALGPGAATLQIMTDDPKAPTLSVPLTTTGVGGSIAFQPNYVDFGPVALNSTATATVTLANVGTDVVTVMDFTLDGANADVFATTEMVMPPLTIQAMTSYTFHVTFKPTIMQQHAAVITVHTDDPKAKLLKLPLDGLGAMLGVTVSPLSGLDFGMVPLGGMAGPLAATITNTGAPLTIASVQIIGGMGASFSVDQMGPFPLDALETKQVNVSFSPTAAGASGATLVITPMGLAPINLPLKGAAVSPKFGYGPTALDFMAVNLGTPSAAQTVMIQNGGASPITIAGITTSNVEFAVSTVGTKLILPAMAQTSFTVVFTPTVVGSRNATLTINLAAGSSAMVTATGVGTTPPKPRQQGCALAVSRRDAASSSGLAGLLLPVAALFALARRRHRKRID